MTVPITNLSEGTGLPDLNVGCKGETQPDYVVVQLSQVETYGGDVNNPEEASAFTSALHDVISASNFIVSLRTSLIGYHTNVLNVLFSASYPPRVYLRVLQQENTCGLVLNHWKNILRRHPFVFLIAWEGDTPAEFNIELGNYPIELHTQYKNLPESEQKHLQIVLSKDGIDIFTPKNEDVIFDSANASQPMLGI